MKKFDYRKITSPEALALEKWKTQAELQECARQMRNSARLAVLPADRSLMHSEVGVVRLAAYGITAWKTFQTVRRFLTYFRSGRKR